MEINSLSSNPLKQFERWYRDAQRLPQLESNLLKSFINLFRFFIRLMVGKISATSDVLLPNVAVLATSSKVGVPSARTVLFKGIKNGGFIFYTNYNSPKAQQLMENPLAEMVFYWSFPPRQIRIFGKVEKVAGEVSDAYWRTRPRESQLGAIASRQSEVILSSAVMVQALKRLSSEYRGKEIPRPKFWGGFCLTPIKMEFWHGQAYRIHDRFCYSREERGWRVERLSP